MQATSTIPIVISIGDPVGLGFVSSLAHPGGNITGLSTVSPEMAGKWLQLLKTVIPGTERIAFLVNLRNPQQVPLVQQAARTLRTDLLSVEASTSDEIDDAFATMAREHAQALIVTGDPVFFLERPRIVGYTASHKLPAIFQWREFAAIGGLMSYGPDQIDLFRRAATYVDKILKGAKPADLPVEQPTKFQLVVNLKTAQALGLTIPTVILAGADEVIE
jgi:putative ABC transport system substrate-binding protein